MQIRLIRPYDPVWLFRKFLISLLFKPFAWDRTRKLRLAPRYDKCSIYRIWTTPLSEWRTVVN